ncbi:MAG: hypothetical protein ACLQGV_10795 [Bryobacteraceae bacterium]
MANSNQWWIAPLALAVLRLLYFEAAAERARMKGRGLVFPASIPIRATFLFLVLASALGACLSYADDPWIAAICCLFLVGGAAWWPATIIISNESIAQRFWWGRTKAIPWKEVTGADRDAHERIIVHGGNGTDIQFSTYHVDRHRFEVQLQQRAGIKRLGRYEDVPSIRPR